MFCFFSLADVIAGLVVIRITLQFLVQAIGVIVLRIRRPDLPRPFRMWLYPLPALVASIGFLFVLVSRTNSLTQVRYAALILLVVLFIWCARGESVSGRLESTRRRKRSPATESWRKRSKHRCLRACVGSANVQPGLRWASHCFARSGWQQ